MEKHFGGLGGEGDEQPPESLLPYEHWTEAALLGVVVQALAYAVAHGLPGEHHFYITFRTDYPGVELPTRLRAQYPQEMTIVLQHQFWDLRADQDGFSVGLSFGGVPSTLRVPYAAISAFADPSVRYGLRFRVVPPPAAAGPEIFVPEAPPPTAATEDTGPESPEATTDPAVPQVVSLDAFRRRGTHKEEE
jgi:hypothetical protein